jgi:hypothetical protein
MGVHRIVWTGGRYAHMSATPPDAADRIWVVVDMSDPEHPFEAGRFELDAPEPVDGKRYAAHHALIEGDIAYLGYTSAGLVVLDVSDMTNPRFLSSLTWEPGDRTHTCMPLPGRNLVVVTDEQNRDGPGTPSPAGPARFEQNHKGPAETRLVRVVDVADPTAPRVLAICPEPDGDFSHRPLRFGPHNTHENRTGSYRSARLVFVTYFNAGLRVYDIAEPGKPVEVAHWIPNPPAGQPEPQVNDVYVERDGRVWLTDRHSGGLYVIEADDSLRALMDATVLPDD